MSSSDWTDLQRELLRRSEALSVVQYDDTPLEISAPSPRATLQEHNSDEGHGEAPRPEDPDEPDDYVDRANIKWCGCGRCDHMPTAPERLCCRDVPQGVMRNEPCICEDDYFFTLCLDTEVLRVAYCELRERGEQPLMDIHKRYRYIAYRQFTRWIWGRLGPRNRKVVPACAVWLIRKMFHQKIMQDLSTRNCNKNLITVVVWLHSLLDFNTNMKYILQYFMGNHAAKVPFHLYCHKGNAELYNSKRTAGTVRWRVCAHTGVAVKLRTSGPEPRTSTKKMLRGLFIRQALVELTLHTVHRNAGQRQLQTLPHSSNVVVVVFIHPVSMRRPCQSDLSIPVTI